VIHHVCRDGALGRTNYHKTEQSRVPGTFVAPGTFISALVPRYSGIFPHFVIHCYRL
jgi:hypothetical protein